MDKISYSTPQIVMCVSGLEAEIRLAETLSSPAGDWVKTHMVAQDKPINWLKQRFKRGKKTEKWFGKVLRKCCDLHIKLKTNSWLVEKGTKTINWKVLNSPQLWRGQLYYNSLCVCTETNEQRLSHTSTYSRSIMIIHCGFKIWNRLNWQRRQRAESIGLHLVMLQRECMSAWSKTRTMTDTFTFTFTMKGANIREIMRPWCIVS